MPGRLKKTAASTPRTPQTLVFFNPKDLHETLEEGFKGTVNPEATVFLLGVMQYLAAEVIEAAFNIANQRSNGQPAGISEDNVQQAAQSDNELRKMFANVYRKGGDDPDDPANKIEGVKAFEDQTIKMEGVEDQTIKMEVDEENATED